MTLGFSASIITHAKHETVLEGRGLYPAIIGQAVLEFARYFVQEVFEKSFLRDRARLAGRQLSLLKDSCEFLYRLEQDQENRS